MKSLCGAVLAVLAVALCVGCGDSSPQPWEAGKSRSAGEKSSPEKDSPKVDDAARDADAGPGEEAESPHKVPSPHGAMNPHGGMSMPGGKIETKVGSNGKLDLETVHFTVPKSWVPKSHSAMMLAEFAVPRADGDKEDGRLTVSQFGGTVENNVDRWKGQFSKLDKGQGETLDAGGIKITVADFTGTYEDSRGMMGSAVTRPDYRLLGGIFQLPNQDGLYFIKCYGPKKTITARADEIKEFLHSLKVGK